MVNNDTRPPDGPSRNQHAAKRRARLATAASLCLLPELVHAAAIGAPPDPDFRAGVMAAFTRADLDDPDGPTDTKSYLRLALLGTARLAPAHRLLGEIYYHRFDLDAGVRQIGQDVTRIGAAVSVQRHFPQWRAQPWLGLGIAYSSDDYEERVTTAPDGFVDRRFPDRSENAVGLLVNGTTHWNWIKGWDIGVHAQYELPVSGDLSLLTIGFVVIF